MNVMRAADLPRYYNAVDILERNLAERADKICLYSSERNMTFREVSREVNRVGNALKRLDTRTGDVVGILCPDQPEWVAAFFGAMKIGAVALGMNTLLTSCEYAHILPDSRARVVIVHESLYPKIEVFRREAWFPEHVVAIGKADVSYADWIRNESPELETVPTHRDDFATLNYSSGTTGEPKGIFHAHKDLPLTAQLWGVNVLGLSPEDRTFAAAKLFFTFGTGGNLIFPWYVGAGIVLFAGPPRIPTNVLEIAERFQPTILFNAPTGYAAILAIEKFTEKYDLSSLRLCVSAGEALPAPIWRRWKETTGLDILDGIGSTENYHMFISNHPRDIRPGSSGRPVPGYQVRIVDEDFRDVPQGRIGNLLVKGETASLFYLHDCERSRRTFLGEWLFTGDKYYADTDGYYWHAGRSDDMMKVGGIWVSPVEVESALIGHEAVVECAVVACRDSANLVKPKAHVVLKEGYPPSEKLAGELIEYCRREMAEYKRPRWVEFVAELPKTATGKIQRYRLRAQADG